MAYIAYCNVQDVKDRLEITKTKWDIVLTGLCEAVSKRIDTYCRRSFQAAAEGTRYYDAFGVTRLYVDDFTNITTLTVDGVPWVATDYIKYPLNAPNLIPPWPYEWLLVNPDGTKSSFSGGPSAVTLTALFGFNAAVPSATNLEDIWDAAVEYAAWSFKRMQAAYQDSAGIPELGTMIYSKKMPTAVQIALKPYRKVRIR
jgi:hypothetical protein